MKVERSDIEAELNQLSFGEIAKIDDLIEILASKLTLTRDKKIAYNEIKSFIMGMESKGYQFPEINKVADHAYKRYKLW